MDIFQLTLVLLPFILLYGLVYYTMLNKNQPKSDLDKPKSELNANHKSNDIEKIVLYIFTGFIFVWFIITIDPVLFGRILGIMFIAFLSRKLFRL